MSIGQHFNLKGKEHWVPQDQGTNATLKGAYLIPAGQEFHRIGPTIPNALVDMSHQSEP